eukprot:CAMPEP_0197860482 /NCGR_PEP_ID=MMETSP1438-20131217/35881_1 /TAXON_ID=1461541 /ORGANISM="Pterosperma sp., Strain CCMP1384" /LENGTH=342 /DNA_ID=CAMNT_0043477361 /DNA_START=271 /DNA_END=1299 /DNA_ORIENTATION=-
MAPSPKSWTIPKRTDTIGCALEFVNGFIISHYFLWPFWAFFLWFGLVPTKPAVALAGLYFLQMALWKPQFSGGVPFKWCRRLPVWDYLMSYLNATMIREAELQPDKSYVFAMAPHGILALCRLVGCHRHWEEMFPGQWPIWGSFGAAFYIPCVREFSLFSGAMDASRKVLKRMLKQGHSIFLLPGGTKELMLTDGASKDTKLVLLDRKGFVKLAVEHGSDIVPMYCFGEKWCLNLVLAPSVIKDLIYRYLKVAAAAMLGRWNTFMPLNVHEGRPITLAWVFGEPITVEQQDPPDPAYVDKIHAEYLKRVQGLFDRYKTQFGYSDDERITFVTSRSDELKKSK